MASRDGRFTESKSDEGKKAATTSAKIRQSSFGDNKVNDVNNDCSKKFVMNDESFGEIPREITVVLPCHHPGLTSAGSAEDDAESKHDIVAWILDKSNGSADKDHARHRMMVGSKRNGERPGHHPAKRLRR